MDACLPYRLGSPRAALVRRSSGQIGKHTQQARDMRRATGDMHPYLYIPKVATSDVSVRYRRRVDQRQVLVGSSPSVRSITRCLILIDE